MYKFDLVIISYNTAALTLQCVTSALISNQFLQNYSLEQLIIVDNASTDTTLGLIDNFRKNNSQLFKKNSESLEIELNIIRNKVNLGYAKACNLGIDAVKNKLFIICNSDIIIFPNSVEGLLNPLLKEQAELSGIQQLFPNFNWQRSKGDFPSFISGLKHIFLYEKIVDYLYARKLNKKLANCSFLDISKRTDSTSDLSTIQEFFVVNQQQFSLLSNSLSSHYFFKQAHNIGKSQYLDGAILGFLAKNLEKKNELKFDEDYFFYSEEMDLSFRLAKKGKVIFNPSSFVIHYRGSSSKKEEKSNVNYKTLEMLYASKDMFCRKHLNTFTRKFYFFSSSIFFIYTTLFWFTLRMLSPADKLGSLQKIRASIFLLKLNTKLIFK